MAKRGQGKSLSVKSLRLLERWGVERELDAGAAVVVVGPVYLLGDGTPARLAFLRDESRRTCVGYAVERGGQWVVEQCDFYSARTLGYYQRRLKRIGELEEPR